MAQTKAQLLGPVVGDVVMDVSTLSLDAEGNKVGIGHSEPDLTLHVSGVNGLPSSSGSTPTGHLTIRNKAGSTHGMFMGVSDASPWSSWIQAQDAINNATNYPLLLNPNGGNVGIGTVNPSAKLQVLGGSGDQLWLDNAGERYTQISLRNNGTQKAALWLDETNDEFDLFAASGYGIRLLAGGQERLRIDADGDLEYRYNDADTSTEVGATQVPHGFRILNQNNTLGRLAGITFAHGGGESANAGIFHETTNTANTSTAGLGDLTFWTKPTGVSHMVERLRIDSAGRMTANGVSVNNAWGGGDDLVLGGTGSGTRTGITLVSGSDTDGGIYWSHGTGNNRFAGQIAYNHASDMMSFYTNSTAQLRITSGGDVGIGDSAPDSNYGTNLSVHSTATDGARLKLSDGTTGKDNLSGLDIISTGGNAYIINRENSDMLFTTGVGAFSFTTNGFERFLIDSDGRTTAGDGNSTSGTTILQGNYNGLNKLNVIGSHYSDGGTTICYAVRPKTGSVGFVSSAGNGALKKAALEINGEFIFRSASSSTVAIDSTVTLTQKMKIDLSGKVGIGFDAESATLEVQGQNAYASSANSLATSTSKAALRVKGSNNSSDSLWVGVETSSAQPYLQGANGTGSNSKNLLLNPFGANVGIGTTSPGAKFVVSGLSMSNAAGGVELEGSWPWLKFKDTETNQASWIQYVDGGRFYIKEIDYADRNSTPSTVGTERLQINGSGKVGIGVDPDVRLHVRTSANEVGKFETTSTADMAIELKNSSG